MPCESCNVQFTVFRRKRSCTECKRLYCNQCLVKRKEKILCDRCVVFTTRPISKVDLLKLKPKDLIFYLQSKHISTTGCVEKEELVNLVLIHVNNSSSFSDSSNRSSTQFSDDNFSNPFDQIKQTCQNLFTSFTDKIASDLNFDTRPSASASNQNENIFSQPRASSTSPQQMYTSSNSTSGSNINVNFNQSSPIENNPSTMSTNIHRRSYASSNPTSPVINVNSSFSSSATTPSNDTKSNSRRSSQQSEKQNVSTEPLNLNDQSVNGKLPKYSLKPKIIDHIDLTVSECECSDDETITKFTREYMKPNQSNGVDSHDEQEAGPSRNSSKTSTVTKTKDDSSNTSSFEELGASGVSHSDWLFVGVDDIPTTVRNTESIDFGNPSLIQTSNNITFHNETGHSSHQDIYPSSSNDQNRIRRLIRRRSDGAIYNSSSSKMFVDEVEEISEEETSRKRTKTSCCDKCGKSKRNLKRHVAKFKRQLESSNASEAEIKKQLDAFLEYLESCNKNSIENTDSESNDGKMETVSSDALQNGEQTNANNLNDGDDDDNYDFDYDEGIHVYGTNHDESKSAPRQFVDINDYENSSDLDDLSVKQLKEILMLNRIDFKGCCEKTELLERVKRLWNELNSCPSVDKLPTDDLCKICMDAPIECVILECGHMATCTGCGKVLSECPICRQYIVRVVRFFRA